MNTKGTAIRRRLMSIVMLTSGVVLLISSLASFGYEYLTYRASAVRNLTTLGSVIATNSTAALAFRNEEDARTILAALRAEPHVVAGALYDASGHLFAAYPEQLKTDHLPARPGPPGYAFASAHLS